MTLFRDYLACGHSMLVEVLVPIDTRWRCRRDVGSYSMCNQCTAREGGGMQVREITRSTHVLVPGAEVDVDGVLHLFLDAMLEESGFENNEANRQMLIDKLVSKAREMYPGTEVVVEP